MFSLFRVPREVSSRTRASARIRPMAAVVGRAAALTVVLGAAVTGHGAAVSVAPFTASAAAEPATVTPPGSANRLGWEARSAAAASRLAWRSCNEPAYPTLQ